MTRGGYRFGRVVLVAVLIAGAGRAQDAIARGAAAYAAGRWTAAHAEFSAALAAAPDSAARHFDVATAAYRLERYAEARLHYLCAQRRAPADPRIAFNLDRTERRLGLVSPARLPGTLGDVVDRVAAWSDRERLFVVAALQLLGLFGLLVAGPRRRLRRTAAIVLSTGVVAAVGVVGVRLQATRSTVEHAVVLASEAPLRADPHGSLPVVETRLVGESVEVVERSDRWARVRRVDGVGDAWVEVERLGFVR